MRVIAGRWRGRRLATLRGDRVRPTADRVKEALFSILGPELTGAVVLDLCCGTGGLGVEALSRAQDCLAVVVQQMARESERGPERGRDGVAVAADVQARAVRLGHAAAVALHPRGVVGAIAAAVH